MSDVKFMFYFDFSREAHDVSHFGVGGSGWVEKIYPNFLDDLEKYRDLGLAFLSDTDEGKSYLRFWMRPQSWDLTDRPTLLVDVGVDFSRSATSLIAQSPVRIAHMLYDRADWSAQPIHDS